MVLDDKIIKNIAKELADTYYSREKIEELFVQLGIHELYDLNGKNQNQFVAYYNAIRSWSNKNSLLTEDKLLKILKKENFQILYKSCYSGDTWGVPNGLQHFVGRQLLLDKIEISLNQKGTCSVCICACKGLGGIGKTSLVVKYIWDKSTEYSLIVWFDNSDNEALLKKNIFRFGEEKNIISSNEKNQNGIKKIKIWFESEDNKNWLIVFDNAFKEELVKKYYPSKGGKIIITTRNINDFFEAKRINLEKYDLEDIKKYLKEKDLGENDSEEVIKKFAELLDYHPLAVAISCSFIHEKGFSLRKYIEVFKNERLPNNVENAKYDLFNRYIEVLQSFLISLKMILYNENKIVIEYLILCAFLVPENIPRDLFDEDKYLTILKKYSLIIMEKDDFISIHRLVQDAIKFILEKTTYTTEEEIEAEFFKGRNQQIELKRAYKLLNQKYPFGGTTKYDILLKRYLIPHFGSIYFNLTKPTAGNQNLTENDNFIPKITDIDDKYELKDDKQEIKPFKILMKIFKDNPIADALKLVNSALQKNISFEEQEESLNLALKTFKEHLFVTDTNITSTLFHIVFLYIRKNCLELDNNLKKQYRKKSQLYLKEAISKERISTEILKSFQLEAEGYFMHKSDLKKKIEYFHQAYNIQLKYFNEIITAEIPLQWEERTTKMRNLPLTEVVLAGKFLFPGFAHYRGSEYGTSKHELELFIGRGFINGNIIPGKFFRFPTFDSFQCSYAAKEIKIEKFELLKMKPERYKWVLSSNGNYVPKAIKGGEEDGEPLYIGRVYITKDGNPTEASIGKVQASKGGCIVPYWDETYIFLDYEILVSK